MYGAPGKARDDPGGAHKRNFNRKPKGRFSQTKMKRASKSRSKSRG